MKALEWIVEGRVQGVSFRYFTYQAAQQIGIAGWVKNMPDGTVKVLAIGEEETLERFQAVVRRGPPMARVDGFKERTVEPIPRIKGFEITY